MYDLLKTSLKFFGASLILLTVILYSLSCIFAPVAVVWFFLTH